MKVEVFIPVYHPDEKFLSTLKMLKQQKGVTFTVHVVDSAEMGTAYRTALNEIARIKRNSPCYIQSNTSFVI